MREIHDLLNTLGEEQNITAQKTALNHETLSLLDLLPLSTLRMIIAMRANGCLNNKLEKNGFVFSTWNYEGNGRWHERSPTFLTSFSLNEIERLRLRVLKPERLPLVVALQHRGLCSQRGKHTWAFLADRSHDDNERVRTLSDAVWPLPRHLTVGRSI
jgi:hypothetical protein